MSVNRTRRMLLIALPLLFLAMAFYYPLLRLFREGITENGRFTFRYLADVFTDPYFRRVILFTAKQALWSTLLSIAIGLPWAYLFTKYRFPLKSTLRSLTIVPFVLPSITVVVGFILFFGNNGYLNQTLMFLFGLESPPIRILYSLPGIVLAHAFYNAPLVARMVNAQWEQIDPAYEESARALGAGRVRRFAGVTLPMLMPGLMTSSMLVFIFCFLSFPIVLALGGAQFATLEVEIYTQFIVLFEQSTGAALAIVEILLSLLFTFGYVLLEGRFTRPVSRGIRRPTIPLFRWSWGKGPLWLFVAACAVLYVGPLGSVIADSFTRHWAGHTILTLDWYTGIFRPEYNALIGAAPLRSVLNSLRTAALAMAVALAVGVPIAFVIARSRFRGRRLFDTLVMAPLGVSSVALGAALLAAFLRPPLQLGNGWAAIVLAHTILAYPFVIRAVVPILEGLDRAPVEAARSLGANGCRAFLDIELPLIRRGLLVGAVLAFAISLGEISATIMLAQPEWKTMPLVVNDLRAARSFGAASAMSCLLMATTSVAFVVIERFGAHLFGGTKWSKSD
ncbi:iron ABC transporter permease [Candidatus Bipolaricaulota bacterium]|nr:iron ABC transporter permease [Candidatus Bipolaricaulota bacterium]